jgi:hypothetical protein
MSKAFFGNERATYAVSEALSSEEEEARKRSRGGRQANPITPIPPRASAYPERGIKIRPRYPRISEELTMEEVMQVPTRPEAPAIWQYESEGFAAESSLPSLSLIVPLASPVSPSIDELDTVPPLVAPQKGQQADITELDTRPPVEAREAKKTAKLPPEEGTISGMLAHGFPDAVRAVGATQAASWTAGRGANSVFAQRIAQKNARVLSKRALTFHVLDRLRWWLLYPGRLEFGLWLSGTLLLLGATTLLILGSLLSVEPLQMPSKVVNNATIVPACSGKQQCGSISVTTAAGVKLLIVDAGELQVGKAFRLQGQGFSPHGTVNLTYDAWLPCQPAVVRADEHGIFLVSIMLGRAGSGEHRVAAYDIASTHVVILPIKLVNSPLKSGVAPVSPVETQPAATAIIQATPTPFYSQPTAVVASPTPQPSPTAVVQPTPTPVPATPTPQPTKQPTPKPPVSVTPTAAPIVPTPTVTHHSMENSVLSLQMLQVPFQGQTVLFSKCWHWILALIYTIAVLCLSLAGVLLNRRKVAHQ